MSKVLSSIFAWYTRMVYRTGNVELRMNEEIPLEDSIIVFWHGDSMNAYYLMKLFPDNKVGVVMTSDPRGEQIDAITRSYGGIPIRLPNGPKARHGIKQLIDLGKEDREIVISFSVDGPLGPYHEPSKMVFHISNKTEKKVLICRIGVKRKLRLNSRWDKYVIPLPFAHIVFDITALPPTSKEELAEFDQYQSKVRRLLEEPIEF